MHDIVLTIGKLYLVLLLANLRLFHIYTQLIDIYSNEPSQQSSTGSGGMQSWAVMAALFDAHAHGATPTFIFTKIAYRIHKRSGY